MSGTVWTKFYWADWESDPALRLCSLGAQGLWMRMLCIAAAHDPIGYVAVAGRGLDETALARMTGCSGSEVSALLGELDRNGVFSRDRQKRIYSRRMVADAKAASIARKNGRKGGNPSLRTHTVISEPDNQTVKLGLKPQEPEARSQKEVESLPSVGQRPGPSRGSRLPEDWQLSEVDRAYARQVGASDAEIERQAERFRNHWHGKSGRDATKASWPATWRNWCLTAQERGDFRGGAPPGGPQGRLALASASGQHHDLARQARPYSADRPQRAGPHDAFAAAMADVASRRDER